MDLNTKYETLPMEDDSESDGNRSNPFLSAFLLSKGRHMEFLTKRPTKLDRLASSFFSQSALIGYCAISTTIIVILAATILVQLGQSRSTHYDQHGVIHATFGADPSYMSLDHKFDDLWEDLGAKDLIVKLPDPEYGGKPTYGAISMFHQLHCLSSLRNALQQAREGVDPGFDWRDNDHWPHCLDYLRKTLLCRADEVVERRLVFDNGTVSHFIDGAQDVRRCWDNRHLIQIMREQGRHVTTKPFP